MARTLKALKDFKEIYDQFDGEIIAVATAAVCKLPTNGTFWSALNKRWA